MLYYARDTILFTDPALLVSTQDEPIEWKQQVPGWSKLCAFFWCRINGKIKRVPIPRGVCESYYIEMSEWDARKLDEGVVNVAWEAAKAEIEGDKYGKGI